MNRFNFEIRPFTIADYDVVLKLWKKSDGVALSAADEREAIALYLDRNPGLSLLATQGESILGTLLCGHDGRRAYLHHLAVEESSRRLGIGRALVMRALGNLSKAGIDKCHVLVLDTNEIGATFWKELGWEPRTGLQLYSQFCRDVAPLDQMI
ncbi:MAG: GNAT family N-acetyltransferase [Planctomycetaceae bacterium]|nr:GNAT family N-acetyltransferase [Planctomycetaceae bacterium]